MPKYDEATTEEVDRVLESITEIVVTRKGIKEMEPPPHPGYTHRVNFGITAKAPCGRRLKCSSHYVLLDDEPRSFIGMMVSVRYFLVMMVMDNIPNA